MKGGKKSGAVAAALASAAAEVAAAQQRTRDIEKARQRLEADLADAAHRRGKAASDLVSLARGLGIDRDVLAILATLHGWHAADNDRACQMALYGELDDRDDD